MDRVRNERGISRRIRIPYLAFVDFFFGFLGKHFGRLSSKIYNRPDVIFVRIVLLALLPLLPSTYIMHFS